MSVNREGPDGGSSSQGDGAAGMSAPSGRSNETQGSGSSGGMRAPAGGDTRRERTDPLKSRTDRGNQNDEGVGSSDLDPIPDMPDVTGTTDELGS
jgi:hypothetical protein